MLQNAHRVASIARTQRAKCAMTSMCTWIQAPAKVWRRVIIFLKIIIFNCVRELCRRVINKSEDRSMPTNQREFPMFCGNKRLSRWLSRCSKCMMARPIVSVWHRSVMSAPPDRARSPLYFNFRIVSPAPQFFLRNDIFVIGGHKNGVSVSLFVLASLRRLNLRSGSSHRSLNLNHRECQSLRVTISMINRKDDVRLSILALWWWTSCMVNMQDLLFLADTFIGSNTFSLTLSLF